MDVMRHVVQENVDVMFVGGFDELLEFCFGTESGIGGAQRHRPIAVIPTKLGGRRFRPLSVRSLGIPYHRRNPNRIHPQFGKKSLFYLLRNTHHIAPVEIHFGIYFGPIQRFIILLFTIHKTINHGIIHHHRSGILAIAKFRHIVDHSTRCQRHQHLIANPFVTANPNADITAVGLPSALGHLYFDHAQSRHGVVFTQFHWQPLILPHRQY